MLNEDKLIQHLQTQSKGFIGDDAAILPSLTEEQYVISKDLLVENIHFRLAYFSPEDLAQKALQANLSDLAAMGAQPLYILCGISIPKPLEAYATDFLNCLMKMCGELNILLIGGDTTAAKDNLFISITAIGKISHHKIKYRNTAQVNDLICIAGNLGWAHIGFTALEKGINVDRKFIESFLRPIAKIKEGRWLAQHEFITSMMDISDGLYIDLKRLCKLSNKGAVINLDSLLTYKEPEQTQQTLLEGGEDYALLFTVNKEKYNDLSKAFAMHFKYDLKLIGHITNNKEIQFLQEGQYVNLELSPYTHFGEKL